MRHKKKAVLILILGQLSFAPGCASTGGERNAVPSHREIPRLLENQATAWNRGDLEGFMAGYWRSPDLTFSSGGKLTRGWQPMLDRFRESYPDKSTMGKLTFSDLEITDVGSNAALVLGRWRVEGDEPDSGAFSLVLRRDDGQWVIIHDHTSRLAQ